MRIAVLDDYESLVSGLADWGRLGHRGQVTFFSQRLSNEAAIIEAMLDFDAIVLTRERTAMPAQVIANLPRLRLIVTTGKGNAALDLSAATEKGILVCSTQTMGHPTSELAWGLILGLLRRIPLANRQLRDATWMPLLGEDLSGRTLGLLGLGRIGSRMARVGRAFDMDVIAWSQNLTPERAEEIGASYVSREDLFRTADVLSIHVGLERYHDAVGAAELALMQSRSILINTSRAEIVNEAALVAALRNGQILGAGIDVYASEPPDPSHPLLALDNVLATPHMGYSTRKNLSDSYHQVIECIEGFLIGKPVRPLNATFRSPFVTNAS